MIDKMSPLLLALLIGATFYTAGCHSTASPEQVTGDSVAKQAPAGAVLIGAQSWAVRNLNVATFRNGDSIPEARTAAEWQQAGDRQQAAMCRYENSADSGRKYGRLYK